jgi:Rrf2 family transcriptional regulator, nitric oxide-sensitive transcriptional repressor
MLPAPSDNNNVPDQPDLPMRLSKTTNYAIRILIDCAQAEGALVKVAEISERRSITPQNTFKIVHLLSRAGFVRAVRGRHGGVRLARPATEIRIGDVVRAMETTHIDLDNEGARSKDQTRQQLAELDNLFGSALEAFISVLDEHTLDQMTKAKRPDPPSSRKAGKQPARSKPAAKSAAGFRRQQSGPG